MLVLFPILYNLSTKLL